MYLFSQGAQFPPNRFIDRTVRMTVEKSEIEPNIRLGARSARR
jgi:hypothetical protein